MKKILIAICATAVILAGFKVLPAAAGAKVVFVDQDFSTLRSGKLKDRGGVESVGAYEENNWKFWGGSGLLSNADGYYVGYITYKVSAPTNETIQTLKMDLVGRIGTYPDGEFTAEEWIEGGEKYWMRIFVFKENYEFDKENWMSYEDKLAVMPTLTPNPPDTSQEYSFDLSTFAKDGKDVYVTIATYTEWTPDWIGFSHLTLSGTTAISAVTPKPTVKATPTVAPTAKPTAVLSSSVISITDESSDEEESEAVSSDESYISDVSDVSEDEMSSESDEVSSEVISQGSEESEKSSTWLIILIAAIVVIIAGAGIFVAKKKKNG